MRRDPGSKILELPEVTRTTHPNVECAIHPGKAIAGVAICEHVLAGAAVYLRQEPDRESWGGVYCESCAFTARENHLSMRLACAKCVHYHFDAESEEALGRERLSDNELFSMAETEGIRAYCSVRDGHARLARNPFESSSMRWAWNLGFRLARHLDGCKKDLPQELAAKGVTGSA